MSDTTGDDSKVGIGRDNFELREQDKWLPIANVSRIMKNALPPNAKVSKEAKECVQECVSEFVAFITSEASEKCSAEKRKTVNGEDILFAMTSLGFENYSEVLKIYLTKYREHQVAKAEREKRGGTGHAGASATESIKSEEEQYSKSDDNYGKASGEPYSYDEPAGPDGEDAIYEEYTGQYTNVDMSLLFSSMYTL